jgi:hypothetical protein
MAKKRVVVIASGDTERRALPHLSRDLRERGIEISDVRTLPQVGKQHRDERLRGTIKSAWWDLSGRGQPPNKFVILVDADEKPKEDVVKPWQEACAHLQDIPVACIVTVAKWHLEAWFFGDEQGLRGYLGRALGSVDPFYPDEIHDPKRHLKSLLGGSYSQHTAEEIAKAVQPSIIRTRSPSFSAFEQALCNGNRSDPAKPAGG